MRRFVILNRDLRHELLSLFTFVVVYDDVMCLLQSHFLVYIVIQGKKRIKSPNDSKNTQHNFEL